MRVLISALLLPLALVSSACARGPESEQWRAVEVTATPVGLGAAEVGQLVFLGGIELKSEDGDFGGLSDIAVNADGSFLSITDNGHWVRGRLALSETGAPTGVSDVEIGAMRDDEGAAFQSKRDGDSEGMAMLSGGRVAVSFEGSQTIRIYNVGSLPRAPGRMGPALAGTERLDSNGGLEALAPLGDDALLVGSESTGGTAKLWQAPLDAETPVAPQGEHDLEIGFGLAELDRLPDGDFVGLERFYAPGIGNRIRLTRIPANGLSGEPRTSKLAFFRPPLLIDNFEGVSVVPQADGGARLYIVSDNNFNARQRTLLYAFELKKPAEADERRAR